MCRVRSQICGRRSGDRFEHGDFALHYVFSASSSSLTHFVCVCVCVCVRVRGWNPSGLAIWEAIARSTYITHTRSASHLSAFAYELTQYTEETAWPPRCVRYTYVCVGALLERGAVLCMQMLMRFCGL